MNVSIEEVKYISKLCKLSFSDEEVISFANEFEGILNHFNHLSELDLDNVDENNELQDLKPIVRKDEAIKCECETLFSNVKSMQDTYIKVPKIIE